MKLTVIEGDELIRVFDETGKQVALMSDLKLANEIVTIVNEHSTLHRAA